MTRPLELNELLAEVSKEQLMSFVKHISREVRLSGSEEEMRAFQYAKQTLESFGLETKLDVCDAYISLPGAASLEVEGESFPCITHSMAKPVSSLEAELVYVKAGSAENYQSVDVKGKIVLIDGLADRPSVSAAANREAAAAIFINGEYTHEMIVSPIWGNPVPETIHLMPNIPVLSINSKSGEVIIRMLQDGRNKCQISAEVETAFRPIPVLTAEIKGTEQPDQFVMFSGHIDSWHYGAMDNGTADAVILETARILSRHKHLLTRSLRLAFWSGHSHGRYAGSAWYCDTHWEELTEHCALHINIDSVGGKGATVITKSKCMAEMKDLAKEVIADLTGETFTGSRINRAGDQSFWGTGTPSMFMSFSEHEEGLRLGWWWHTTEDTIDKIDPDFLERDCKIYLSSVYRAVSDAVLPINQIAAVEDIEKGLQGWQKMAGARFDLSLALERTGLLKDQMQRFYAQAGLIDRDDMVRARLINEAIMQLSRILVPLNHVKGSVFEHDLALKAMPVPKLSEIEKLAKTEEGSESYHFLRTSLLRKRNKIQYSLKQAIDTVQHALEHLEEISR